MRKLNTGLREFNTPIYDTKKKELRHRRKAEEMQTQIDNAAGGDSEAGQTE